MRLEDKITESIILAMKAKDKIRLEALRAVKSAILIEKTKTGNKETLDENQIIKLLQKLVKQRNDSAKIYKEQNRDELAEMFVANYKKYQDGSHTDYAPYGPIVGS